MDAHANHQADSAKHSGELLHGGTEINHDAGGNTHHQFNLTRTFVRIPKLQHYFCSSAMSFLFINDNGENKQMAKAIKHISICSLMGCSLK